VARWGFFFRGASGDAVTSQSEIAALNEQHRACVRAIIGRIKFLEDFWRGKNAPAAERAGLVSAGHAINTLAVQYLKPYDHWPGREGEAFPQEVTDTWAVQWYFNYLTAMRDHIKGLQDAVRNGELTLRTMSKAKAPEDEVQAWCSSDPWPKTPADARLFPECAHWDVMAAEWPDSIGLPSGGFDAEEWANWLAASRLVKKVDSDEPPQHGAEASQPAKAMQPLAEAPLDDPRMRIQAEAAEHWIRLLASNCSPTVNGISEHMADWCTKNDVKTKGGISPRAGTIRNSILNAQSWTPPQMDRSKAREYIDAKKQAAQVAQPAQPAQPAQVSQAQGVQPVKASAKG